MRASESPFQSYKSKRILSFADLICSSVSGPKSLKIKSCLRFAILSYSEKLCNVFEIVFEKRKVFTKIALIEKNIFERKNSNTPFCCLCVNLPTVKVWGQSDKFPIIFSSLQCPLQVKKLIRENSAK